MSEVDLSKAKAGDTVHFRCGGSTRIKNIELQGVGVEFIFKGCKVGDFFLLNGEFGFNQKHPFDIVKVESK